MTTQRDYYDILGVNRDADAEAVKRAFRKLAMRYHPDRNPEPKAAEHFKEINEAYEVLSDTEKRASYDRFGHAGVRDSVGSDFGFGGFGDIFDAFFGGFGRRRGPQRGADLRGSLALEFEEAIFGCEKEIEVERTEMCDVCRGNGSAAGSRPEACSTCRGSGEVRRTQQSLFGQFVNVSTCDRCRGSGRIITNPCEQCRGAGYERRRRTLIVKVPAGVDSGAQIRLTGEGEAGSMGAESGNLYISLQVRPHPVFRRDGPDLLYVLPVNMAKAALGAETSVPLVDGEATVAVPAGVQTGHRIVLRGKGVPHLGRSGRGDQIVLVEVVTPTELTEAQRKLLEQLASTLPDYEQTARKNGATKASRARKANGDAPQADEGEADKGIFDRIRDAFVS